MSATIDNLPGVQKPSALDTLPWELGRHRILGTKPTCKFVGLSPAEWRRMRARGEAPPPVQIGLRKQGWKIGVLIDWLDSRSQGKPNGALAA